MQPNYQRIGTGHSRERVLIVPHDFMGLSLRLPRIIRRAGFAADVLCLPHHLVARSRHVGNVIYEATPDSLFERLKGILRQTVSTWKAVVIVDEPLIRRLIATGDPVILKNWQKGIFEPGVRDFYLSKLGLEFAYQSGSIQVPPSKVCHSADEIRAFGETHGWPIVIKPPESTNGVGVIQCDSEREACDLGTDLEFPTLAQKFVRGREFVVDMFCDGGKALAWLVSCPIRRAGGRFAGSTARRYLAMPELGPLVEQVAAFTRFEGFCGFDCMEDETTGAFSLIEFHPRPTVGTRFASACGVDMSGAMAAWLNRRSDGFHPSVQRERAPVEAYNFPRDIERCWNERDWRGLGPWLPGSGARHDFFLDDLPLFVGWAETSIKEMLGKMKNRRPAPPDG